MSQLYWHVWGVFLEADGGFCVQALWIRMVSVFLSRLPWTRMILVVGQYAWVGVSEPFGRRGSVSFLDVVILVLWSIYTGWWVIISKVLVLDRDGIGCTEGGVSEPFGHGGGGEGVCVSVDGVGSDWRGLFATVGPTDFNMQLTLQTPSEFSWVLCRHTHYNSR